MILTINLHILQNFLKQKMNAPRNSVDELQISSVLAVGFFGLNYKLYEDFYPHLEEYCK